MKENGRVEIEIPSKPRHVITSATSRAATCTHPVPILELSGPCTLAASLTCDTSVRWGSPHPDR